MLIGRIVCGETLMIMTDDCDIPLTLGGMCVVIKKYTKDGVIGIVSISRETLTNALQFLSNETRTCNVDVTPAQHPIFEDVLDCNLHVLL